MGEIGEGGTGERKGTKSQIKRLLFISLFCPQISVHQGFENPSAECGACLAFVQLRRNKTAARGPSFLLEEGWRKTGPLKGTAGMGWGNQREEKLIRLLQGSPGRAEKAIARVSERLFLLFPQLPWSPITHLHLSCLFPQAQSVFLSFPSPQ